MKITIFFILSTLIILGIVISSVIKISSNAASEMLQGWVNLLWMLIPIFILIIDRICAKRFGIETVNKIEFYILIIFILLFLGNLLRLRLQK